MVLNRVMKGHELDTFFFGMMHLFDTCRHLFFRPTIDDHRVLGAETFGGTHGIHRGVAATDDGYVLAVEQRGVGSRIGSVHEVDAGEVFVAGHHTVQVLTRDVHKARKTGS